LSSSAVDVVTTGTNVTINTFAECEAYIATEELCQYFYWSHYHLGCVCCRRGTQEDTTLSDDDYAIFKRT